MTTLEQAFADTERAADAAAKAASGLAAIAKQLARAAQDGDIPRIRRTTEKLGSAVKAADQEAANARAVWPLTEEQVQAYFEREYEEELLQHAKEAGLEMRKSDERLVAFPTLVKIMPADAAVLVNRKKVFTTRPSKLVAVLKAEQSKKPKFAPDRFIESLFSAYRLVMGEARRGQPALLGAIYEAFTLLPGSSREYDKSEFARDLFLLDRSGIDKTKSGARLSFPASTGTKTARGTLSFVAPDGELVTYYGVSFSEA